MSDATLPETPKTTSEATPLPAAPQAPGSAGFKVGRYASYIFWLMFAINFINYADRFVFSGLSAVLARQFHFNDFQIGFLASAFLLIYTLVAFPLGYLADIVSRKLVVAVGVALWSLATIGTALAGGFFSMLVARALVGVGEGSYYPAGTPLLSAWHSPQRRATVMARWGVGALVGAGIGTVVAGAFASGNWRIAFFVTGIPGLALALLMLFAREKARHEDDPEEEAGVTGHTFIGKLREYLRIPTLRVILGMHAAGFFALTATSSFLVIYFSATYGQDSPFGKAAGLSDTLSSLLPGVVLLVGGISGGLYGSRWANQLARKRSGARVLASAYGFLWAIPFLILALLTPYVLHAIPAYMALAPSKQVLIGAAIFIIFALGGSFFLNVYNGPSSAALQDVLPPKDRAGGGGLELTLAHLIGDSYAGVVVGLLALALSKGILGIHGLGGQQIGLALLITCPIALIISGVIGIRGSRHYAADVAALGTPEDAVVGVAPAA